MVRRYLRYGRVGGRGQGYQVENVVLVKATQMRQ